MAIPPKSVRSAARKGLEVRRKRAKTTKRPGGTAVGVARARDLSSGRNVSDETIRRMKAFFDRHDGAVERAARARDPEGPSAVAWALWGGAAGRRWASGLITRKKKR